MYTLKNVSGNCSYAKDIHNIDLKCFSEEAWSYDLIFRELENRKSIYLVCSADDIIVGYLCASVVLDEVTLERIAVLKQYRKTGIGNKLICKLIDLSLAVNAAVIRLEVRSKNSNAISLYNKCNFKFDAIRKKYYQNPLDDAILMSLNL